MFPGFLKEGEGKYEFTANIINKLCYVDIVHDVLDQ